MTALAGMWRLDMRPDAGDACTSMLAAQALYGPHGAAGWSDGPIALGRRIFRVLPEDVHDDALQVGAGGRLVMAADVRLDNRDELLATLGIGNDRARTLCDAAVLMAAYERWEEETPDRLSGDFAFAVWDRERRRLFLARDFMGHRPLHFHRGKGFFAFASMPKGLHALAEIPYAPDERRAAEFLTLMPEGDSRSFFEGIERVQAGHLMVVTADEVTTRPHWQPRRERLKLRSADDYAAAMRDLVDDAVRVRLRRAARPIAAHLSAGLDSAVVATSAARLMAPAGERLTAYTGVPRRGYDGPVPADRIADEGPLAAATAALYPNIDHERISATRPLLDSLDRNFHLFEQPMLNLCNSWALAINDAARSAGITVLLNGQMGNLSISYTGSEALAELFASGRWLRLIREGHSLVRKGGMRWRTVAGKAISPFLPEALVRRLRQAPPDLHGYSAISPERLRVLNLAAQAESRGLDFTYRSRADGFSARLWALRRVDLGNVNKGVLGGWGIDQRDPTADRRLVEFCLSVPSEQFLAGGVFRGLAHRAFADRLPATVLTERRRGLQGADWHEGLTASRVTASEELERLEECAPAAAVLDLARMRQLVTDMPSGGWEKDAVMQSYRLALLRGLSTGHFLRKAMRSNH
ncbi:MAG: asparagine synthase-related protein [Pseudomonadota bacterium]|jgi:asparagine synthase (glutamine-hydrolysing)|uniref:Asparagine synthetase [glutamine-hydrolyzing] n=1 Tax=hydrothermal vent metagenome TaxID=652676 RepID=A0A160TK83_9ZZZZ